MRLSLLCCVASLAIGATAFAAITVPGADGSDGVFNPTANVTIDLSQATTRQWDQPSPVAGKGVYDPNKWAVIFKYSSVNIPAGVTVTFKNHPSRAPVVWLVSGNVTVSGAISLNGEGGGLSTMRFSESGPGGFRGGSSGVLSTPGTAGFGPGGGGLGNTYLSGPGSYGTAPAFHDAGTAYGNPGLTPLLGGSGAGASRGGPSYAGGAGGGALLIAAASKITLTGAITANGGDSAGFADPYRSAAGSGGGIRLVADEITGSGAVRAVGGSAGDHRGGDGRIRVEGNSVSLTDRGSPVYALGLPGTTAVLWPPAADPTVRVTSLGDQVVPADPRSSLDFPSQDVTIASPTATTIRLECANVPLTWKVKVRVVPKTGPDVVVNATLVSGDQTASVWEAQATLPNGFSAIQARASKQ